MLQTYIKYKNTLYANIVDDGDSFEKGLSCNLSPRPVDYWFNTVDYPQIAADTFGRVIAVFSKASINGAIRTSSKLFVQFATAIFTLYRLQQPRLEG
ncbi:uncharacterized protein RHIMIDRAFT_253030 [Rhizopus microsporus ATCC 52813]|uniref:Uncharacterized protein n=1 Tax=Rhizopus microsporus ATCC 52813 TaxID=1340429 RepID=A0A2G4T7Z8_RHIZD|nr:uncharacterized protein RHIMIDRAFT_253030 [Rhizopus microsporus ATCC 52813]PHZ17121.1 hypothetical protein RHIMIDRAFT_253030 [Rhizopus microsporus ATCC 52813]